MSHTVQIPTEVNDAVAVAAACQRLNLPEATHGSAHLYASEATGLIVRLPNWEYPIVIDTQTGSIQFDNFEGVWGDPSHLGRFLQIYACEKAKLEARRHGHPVTETQLEDGRIRLEIQEGP